MNSLNIKIPTLDVCTRWNSTYIMIHKLISIKSDIERLYEFFTNSDLDSIKLENSHWEFMGKFHDAFRPTYDFTVKLQGEQLGMGKYMSF